MCKMCNCKGGCCVWDKILHILLLVGGINWGLVGLGMILNTNLNIVYLIFGNAMVIEAVVYILVGIAAIVSIFGCRCSKCRDGLCTPMSMPASSNSNSPTQM